MNIASSSIATIARSSRNIPHAVGPRRALSCDELSPALGKPQDGQPAAAPSGWTVSANYFTNLVRLPTRLPSWWTKQVGYDAGIRTWTDAGARNSDGDSVPSPSQGSSLSFYLTLAGHGRLLVNGNPPITLSPGTAVFTKEPMAILPEAKSGKHSDLTVAHVVIHHSYLSSRLLELVVSAVRTLELQPQDELAGKTMRLLRGAITKDFSDQFDAERALFDFVVAALRWAQSSNSEDHAEERMKNEVRAYVLARLPQAIEVSALAAHFGMSRSHFSHLFHQRTGLTPAHFATLVRIQRVENLLMETREPLKAIADVCGFANANHLCKVFRRFRNASPTEFRQNLRPPGIHAGPGKPLA